MSGRNLRLNSTQSDLLLDLKIICSHLYFLFILSSEKRHIFLGHAERTTNTHIWISEGFSMIHRRVCKLVIDAHVLLTVAHEGLLNLLIVCRFILS